MAENPALPASEGQFEIEQSIERLISSSNLTCVSCSGGNAFLIAAPNLSTGCVLLDIRLADSPARPMHPRLIELKAWLPVIVITAQSDPCDTMHSIRSNCAGSRERPYDDNSLCDAIQLALAPSTGAADPRTAATRIRALSPRERSVLVALAAGHSNKSIADALGLSVRTIEGHRARMMKRLGVRQFAEAIRLAVTAELIKTARSD